MYTIVNIINSSIFPFQFIRLNQISTNVMSAAAAHDAVTEFHIRCIMSSVYRKNGIQFTVDSRKIHFPLHFTIYIFVIEVNFHILMELKASHFQFHRQNQNLRHETRRYAAYSIIVIFFSPPLFPICVKLFFLRFRLLRFFPFLDYCYGRTELRAQSLMISFFPSSYSKEYIFMFFLHVFVLWNISWGNFSFLKFSQFPSLADETIEWKFDASTRK